MRRFAKVSIAGPIALVLFGLLCGCSNSGAPGSPEAEAKLKDGYKKKNITLDDVPPSQRAMVEGFMKGSKNGKPPVPPTNAPSPAVR